MRQDPENLSCIYDGLLSRAMPAAQQELTERMCSLCGNGGKAKGRGLVMRCEALKWLSTRPCRVTVPRAQRPSVHLDLSHLSTYSPMSDSESWAPTESLATDPLVPVFSSPSRSRSIVQRTINYTSPHSLHLSDDLASTGEREPLLAGSAPDVVPKKLFYRARPLWLVPFAITAALVRGMTLAPRIEVFTQLSCSRLHHSYNHTASTNTWMDATSVMPAHAPLYFGLDPLGPQYSPAASPALAFAAPAEDEPRDDGDTGADDPRQLPSARCMLDPAVEAGAARIQTIFTTTMGLLSALTTGWWGHFGERHGRTKVLAIATLGLFLTDLIFILASTPSTPFSSHGHKLLLIAPVIEGLLGGWSTLQSATSAYISDCTSSGSRASVFSRFTGVSFLGFGLGPILGGWLIRHPIAFFTGPPHPGQPQGKSVTTVFWVAIFLSFFNLFLMLFVYPESVTQEQRDLASGKGKGKARDHASSGSPTAEVDGRAMGEDEPPADTGIIRKFLSPLAIFLPVPIFIDGSTRKRKDWSLTLLACSMFGYMLSTGLYQIKYLYAGHVYGWGVEQLSYYISFLGSSRALYLLLVFPLIISTFKPKSKSAKAKAISGSKAAKPKPTKSHLAQEIKFDLGLTRLSLCIDIVANLAIVFAPAPTYKMHSQLMNNPDTVGAASTQFQSSQALFIVASWMQCLGAGLVPAVQSLALCIVQARSLLDADAGQGAAPSAVDAGTGRLFGALAVLQATGQMILGPLLFGLVYSGTVATFPKAVFVTAIAILFASLAAIMLVRSPLSEVKGKNAARRRRQLRELEEEQRGRSRVSKDLRGYGSTSEQGPSAQAAASGSS
ncbi:major facilitator superfamily domain-containing protein [Mycena sp. CBHHK59/15]|nr:major facilitator superfamily domain-containing protein [Mycena sp. CBHHK59/15]